MVVTDPSYSADNSPITPGSESEKSDSELLSVAKKRLNIAQEAETERRSLALEDLRFRSGEQWPENVMRDRQTDGRPCLVINRIPQFIQQVTNDQRQNRPSIKVHPVDDKGDPKTAKVIQGLIRHIEYNSSADAAYDTGFEYAATGGFGYWRVITAFSSPTSFEQELLIKRIRNPFSVYFDPFAQEPDGSDANWALIVEDMSPEDYRAQYPKSKLAAAGAWEDIGNSEPSWFSNGATRIAEYFYKEFETKTLVQLSTGETLLKDEAEALIAQYAAAGQISQIVREREAQIPVIKWCKINACEILEETIWPGKYIPIVPVYGTDLYIDGKRILEGIVRNAKDSQRMYNYWASAETETIALAPRAPFIVAEGQLEGYEGQWNSANRKNHAYLQYRPIALNGDAVPPPQRNTFEPAIQAISQARMLSADDMKATTGIYDAALGRQSNETSGVAIQRRNVQAQTSNFHFIDNLTRSIKHTGRILIDVIPYVYDTARAARIIGEDGEQEIVQLNAEYEKDGQKLLYRMDVGQYDVTVDVGPSFASKRQEAVATMMEMTKAYPQLMQIAGDLMVKNMDAPGASDLADRIKKTIPPELLDDPAKRNQQIPPQIQAQMAQMGQMLEQAKRDVADLLQERDQKLVEIESKERIEMKKLEVQLEIKRAEIDAKDSLALLTAEIKQLEARQAQLHGYQPIEGPASQEPMAPNVSDGAGYPGAEFGDGGIDPTGGESPGSPMEDPIQ